MSGDIQIIDICNGTLSARILTLGAAVQDLRLAGVDHPLVLGHAMPAAYRNNPAYLGVVVGRVANRIARGQGEICGVKHHFDRNEGGCQTLHGGHGGSGTRLWRVADKGRTHITLTDSLPDGHMGFPGKLEVEVTYLIEGATLETIITATSDAPTLCSLAPHIYFNLSGQPTIDDHCLIVLADTYLPTEAGLPTGKMALIQNTPFDLRQSAPIPPGLDHNYCLAKAPRPLTQVAQLRANALTMTLATTEPGLQVYDGSGLRPPFGPRAGVALEPQRWPDAVNQPWRAQTDLAPGQTYTHLSRFRFAWL